MLYKRQIVIIYFIKELKLRTKREKEKPLSLYTNLCLL
jgi:hypothetical protein